MNFHVSRWDPKAKIKHSMQIACGSHSSEQIMANNQLNPENINEWFSEMSPNFPLSSLELINHLPFLLISWKDMNLSYQGCNTALLNYLGLKSSKDLIGKTAYDLTDNGRVYEDDDKTAVDSGLPQMKIQNLYVHKKVQPAWIKKIPLFSENEKPYGVLCIGSLKESIIDPHLLLSKVTPYTLPKILNKPRFQVDMGKQTVFLSRREAGCLLYLLKGFSTQKISEVMTIGPRTVNGYIEKLKYKFNCNRKIEIVTKIMQSNFLEKIQNNLLA